MKNTKKILVVILLVAVTMTSGVFANTIFANTGIKEFRTSERQTWTLTLSSGSIGAKRYSITAIARAKENKDFQNVYVDVTLYSSSETNLFNFNTGYKCRNLSVTISNPLGTISYGNGESTVSVTDPTLGYGGTTLYI